MYIVPKSTVGDESGGMDKICIGHGGILAIYFFYPLKHLFSIVAKRVTLDAIKFSSEILRGSCHDIHESER